MNEIDIFEKLKETIKALPPLVEAIVEGPDFCASICLLLLLLYLSRFTIAAHPRAGIVGFRIGTGAAMVYLALVFWRFPPQTSWSLLVAVLRSLITAGLFFAISSIAIPIARFCWEHTFAELYRSAGQLFRSWRRRLFGIYKRHAALFREFRLREGRFITQEKREQIESETRARRDQAARAAAEEAERRQRQAAAHVQEERRKLSDIHRREDAKLQCMLIYDRYASALAKSFQRRRLDQYFATYMSETHSAEAVETRAKQLIEMLQELASESGYRTTSRFQSLSEVASFFEGQRALIRSLPYERDVVDTLMVSLNQQEDASIRDFLRTAAK